MIYLQNEQLRTNLILGKAVEQWLGYTMEDNYTLLKWISIEKENNGDYSVAYIESIDEGVGDFIDIYEFSTLDPDEPFGIVDTFHTHEEAVAFSLTEYGASIERFVNAGMIQDEYFKYINDK